MPLLPKPDNPDLEFDLAGMAAIAEKAGVDTGASPEGDAAAEAAEKEAADQAAFEAAAKRGPAGAEGEPLPEELEGGAPANEGGEGEPTAEELEAKATADAAKAEADAAKAEADAAKASEDAKEAERQAELSKGRDADLDTLTKAMDPHTRPKTRQVIDQFKSAAQKARDEAAAARAEVEASKARIAELEAATKAAPVSDDVIKERDLYRERVRELDAEKDPEIVKKYDSRMKANDDAVVAVLKERGYDKTVDDKGNLSDNPAAIPDLMAKGISFKTMAPIIAQLDKKGQYEEAETIRAAVRDNMRLKQEKSAEIQTIKADFENRAKTRNEQNIAQTTQILQNVVKAADKILAEDLGGLAKKHTFLVKPAAPLATDTPAIAAAKKSQLAEFEKVEKEIGTVASSIASIGKTGDAYVTAEARKNALAIQSIVLKQRVLPYLEKQVATLTAELKASREELGKIKGAGAISRAHGAAAAAPKGGKDNVPAGATLEDGLKAFAASQGIAVNT